MTTTTEVLTAAVDAVVRQDLSSTSTAQLQAAVASAGRQAQRLSAFGAMAAAELNTRVGGRLRTDDGGSRSVPGWVAEATAESPAAAGRQIRLAELLRASLPGVAAAVLDGTVGYAQAQVLTRLVGPIGDAQLAEAEPNLLITARLMDPVQLGIYVRHLLATWVEPLLDDDEAGAHRKRYLKTRHQADGSVWGSFRLPGGDAETVLTALEPLARSQGKDEQRSAAQRRADALVEVCEQVLRHADLPDAGGARPQLSYVLPADWAARQAEQDSCRQCQHCAAHTPRTFADLVAAGVPHSRPDSSSAGGGAAAVAGQADHARADGAPVPAEHACAVAAWTGPQTRARIETILCDARISRVLLDSAGQVRGLEALTDSVTPAQRRALAARDLGCGVRGCTRPPAMCDAHHLRARKDDGDTTLDNLVLLCRRHHVLWHLGKIRLLHLHVPWITTPTGPPPPARDPVHELSARA